ncbi:MAG TPA: M20/M25/M40 family metallo-hydrolase [Rhizomicrobium sp.]|jgi:Zn-dependent M28 family amino/carboxypeptidase|nr:M20/M25/M40 family metallo-hydrolase [Rhizomicrobium sp.]
MIKFASLLGLIILSAVPAFADPATAVRLRDQALTDPTAYDVLESLTTEIGPRPAGSPAQMRARDWALAKMKALGFTNVHAEPFAKQAWLRDAESAEILSPFPQKLAILGLGNSVSTPPEGITAELVVLKSMAELRAAPANAFVGKILLVSQPMTRTQDGSGYGAAVAARYAPSEASRRGAVAYLTRSISTSTARAPHTGTTLYAADAPRIPAGALGVPDADLLEHMAVRGPVRLHLLLQSHVVNATAWTISGDVAGSSRPDQVIVVGGHIDSWDPGTGAIDDGAGVAIAAAAGHLIAQLPRHPARTIRVVFWGSEETGGSGAAYLDMHKNELDKIVMAGESDLGSDNVYKLELPPGAAANLELSPLSGILAPLKIMVATTPALDAGSDVEDIQHAGVPVLALSQDANRYFDYHHSADDTLAIVRRGELNQNVAAWAATLDMVADSDLNFRAAK